MRSNAQQAALYYARKRRIARATSFVLGATLTSLHTVKPWSQGSVEITNATVQVNMVAEGPFSAFYLMFRNPTALAQTITRASYALAYGLDTDGRTPLNAAGDADNSLWTLIPGLASFVIPAGTGAESPNFVSGVARSPRIAAPSVVRNDADPKPWLLVRLYTARISGHGLPILQTDWPGVDLGRHWTTHTTFSDRVTTPSGGTWTSPNRISAVYAAQFEMVTPGISFVEVGDSVDQGYQGEGTTTDHNNSGHVGCAAVSTQECPVSYANFGEAGTNSANFVTRTQAILPFLSPGTLLSYPTYTPNDSFDASTVQVAFARAMLIAQQAASNNGVKTVFRTPTPWGYAGANLVTIETYLAQVRAMASQGIDVLDWWAVLNDPDNDGTIIEAYGAADGHHPSEAGHAAVAAGTIEPYLSAIISTFVPAPSEPSILREDGAFLLREDGGRFLLEA